MTSVSAHDSRVDFLEAVPIFAGLSTEMRAAVAARARWAHVPAEEWLFRQDEPGDSLYVVCSGRLEILLERPREEVLRVLTRGAVVGELALITGSPRSASVRARRDSELLRLDRGNFLSLLTAQPDFSVALARELGQQLQLSRGLPLPVGVLPGTVAVVPLGPGDACERFSAELAQELRGFLRVDHLDARAQELPEDDYTAALDHCERNNEIVLLIADPERASTSWIDFCLRQADRTLVLCGPGAAAAPRLRDEHIRGCDVFSTMPGGSASMLEPVVAAIAPRLHRPLPAGEGFSAEVRTTARRLAGRSVGIVLSGGGARGFAHIGVLDELVSAGVAIDRIGGCSMGAYVGAMFAAGMTSREMTERCRREFVQRSPLSDYTVPSVSLVRGHRAEAMLRRTFGPRTIEWLPRDYFCVSCDLVTGELVVHRWGSLYEAVAASMCLPAIFPPVGKDGRLLVDGGVLNNLPVEPMAASAEGPVIAVDVTAQFQVAPAAVRADRSVARDWLTRRIAVRGASTVAFPTLKETVTRSITIGSVDAVAAARQKAQFLIEPETAGVGMLEFEAIDRMIAAGRRAAIAALDQGLERLTG
jgi:predicted acylesterase/phospholipase RssA